MADLHTPRDTTFGTLEERHDALWKRVEVLEGKLAKAEESDRESIAMYHRARERAEQAEQRAKAALDAPIIERTARRAVLCSVRDSYREGDVCRVPVRDLEQAIALLDAAIEARGK